MAQRDNALRRIGVKFYEALRPCRHRVPGRVWKERGCLSAEGQLLGPPEILGQLVRAHSHMRWVPCLDQALAEGLRVRLLAWFICFLGDNTICMRFAIGGACDEVWQHATL